MELRQCTPELIGIYEQYIKPPTRTDDRALDWNSEIGGSERVAQPLLLLPSTDYLQRGLKHDKALLSLWNGDRKNGDESADDMALLNKLAYWCNRDTDKMAEAFLTSPHAQQKDAAHWKKSAERKDYLRRSAEKAARDCTRTAAEDDTVYRADRQRRAIEDFSRVVSPTAGNTKPDETVSIQTPDDLKEYSLDDMGAARLYADMYRGNVLYIPEYKSYWTYMDGRWQQDKEDLKAKMYAKALADFVGKLIPPAPQTDGEKAPEDEWDTYRKHYKKYRGFRYRGTQIRDAQDELHASSSAFDTQAYLLNCKNGTLNIQTMELKPHNPADYISKMANVVYNPIAYCERWEKFIDEITEGNEPRAITLQKALGYALQGKANEECFFIANGEKTRNGKGTLFDTTMNIFGDYGVQIDFNTIARGGVRDGSRPTPDLARLPGVRLALANEPQKGICFDEALIKQLTGNDDIVARPLYGGIVQFKPVFKLIVSSNSKPTVADDSLFSSGRIKILPFTRHFKEEERDSNLKDFFRDEDNKSGIFNWLLKGYKMYLEDGGIHDTEEMKRLAEEYRHDNDYVGQFLDERVDLTGAGTITVKTLRTDYSNWCIDAGTTPLGLKLFKEELKKRDIVIRSVHNHVDGVNGVFRPKSY